MVKERRARNQLLEYLVPVRRSGETEAFDDSYTAVCHYPRHVEARKFTAKPLVRVLSG
jgi:hypothetical protein